MQWLPMDIRRHPDMQISVEDIDRQTEENQTLVSEETQEMVTSHKRKIAELTKDMDEDIRQHWGKNFPKKKV